MLVFLIIINAYILSLEKLADELQYYNFIGESRLSLYTATRAVEPFPGFIKAASTQGRRNLKPQLYYPPHYENRAFRKRSSNRRNFKIPGFRFDGYGKHFEKPGKLGKRWRHENHAIATFLEH